MVLRLMLNSGNFILCPHSTKVLARFCKGAPLYTRSGIFHAIMLKTVEDVTITSFSIFVLVSYSSLSSTLLLFYSCWIEIDDDFFHDFRHNVDDKFCRFLDAVCFT